MAAYKEIVAKSIIGKGKKSFKNNYEIEVEESPSTVLGCWVINHLTMIGDNHNSKQFY